MRRSGRAGSLMQIQKRKPKHMKMVAGKNEQSIPELFLWRGNEIEDLKAFMTRGARCTACGKEATVVVAELERRTNRSPAGHFPTKLGTRGCRFVPKKSPRLAALCTLCGRVYHLACIENVTMNGISFYYCPRCQRELGPALRKGEKNRSDRKQVLRATGCRE